MVGPGTDGTSTDGTSTDGTSTDGTSTDGTSTDGTSTDGTSTDGTSTDEERSPRVTSNTQPLAEDDVVPGAHAAPGAGATAADDTATTGAEEQDGTSRRERRRARRAAADADAAEDSGPEPGPAGSPDPDDRQAAPRGGRPSLPLVPVLAVLLVLLLAAGGWLWFTRPDGSPVRTGDYTEVLQAARSEVVDLTSFDYLTLDDDIAQVKRITTGDLQTESVAQLNDNRQQLTDTQAVVNTQIVGAGVTAAHDTTGTVLLVIEATQQTTGEQQAQVVRYRIQVELTKVDGRWLLSGISGR
jgi:Mce-associated membrane protein